MSTGDADSAASAVGGAGGASTGGRVDVGAGAADGGATGGGGIGAAGAAAALPMAARRILSRRRCVASNSMISPAPVAGAVAGTVGTALVVNFPGSPKAIRECLPLVAPTFVHAVELLRAESVECGSD